MKPSGDLVIKDVDEEIRLLMDNSIADVFNTLDNVTSYSIYGGGAVSVKK